MIHHPNLRRQVILAALVITGFAVSLAPAGAHAQTNTETQRVLLKMRDGVEPHPQGVFASYQNLSTVKTMPLKALGIVILEVPADWNTDELIEALVKDPAVEYGARDQPVRGQSVRPDDLNHDPDPNNRQWGLDGVRPTDMDVNAPRAWAYTTGSTEVVVAVLDSGIDYTHPDLRNNLWVNQAESRGTPGTDDDGNGFVDDVHGYDFFNDDGSPWDDDEMASHGTAVAGIIAAQGNNGLGTVGVAWNTRLMAVKVADRLGNSFVSIEAMGINYVIEMKRRGVNIRAINVSLALAMPLSGSLAQLWDTTLRELGKEDVLMIIAAGNSNHDVDGPDPANFDLPLTTSTQNNIIMVAASDRDGSRSSFSNYGLTSVDLAAPGTNIYSPRSRIGSFGAEQTRSAGLLFDDAEPQSQSLPSASTNWFPGPASASSPLYFIPDSISPTGNAWTNRDIKVTDLFMVPSQSPRPRYRLGGQAILQYGPIDLSAFPSTQTRLLANFKAAYGVPTSFLRLFRVEARNSITAWTLLRLLQGPSGDGRCRYPPCWQEINVPIPPRFYDDPAFELRFRLLVLSSSPTSNNKGDLLIKSATNFLDDIGIGRVEGAAISYEPISGTSFAAPFVSGAVALLASHRPELNYLEIRRAILDNVRRTPTWEPLVASGGILDLAAALASVTSPGLTVTPPHPVFSNGEPTTLTIALTREPGADSDATNDDQVIVQIIGDNPTVVNIQPPTLTFTAENWHIPQPVTVTVTGPDDTTLRLGVEPNGSDDLYHDVAADIPLDSLDVSRVRLTPGIVTPGEAVTATVELNAAAPAPIAVTLTLTVDMPAYSTEVTGRIAVGERLATFTLTPAPAITASVSAQIALTAIRTDTDTPLELPQLPTLRIVPALMRLRLRAFLEGALQ